MTIGIYCIEHKQSGKKYIGKSINIEQRWASHKWALRLNECYKDTNRHLFNAVKKYGLSEFEFKIIESFSEICEKLIAEQELYWMDYYKTCDREYGYNLRKDSSTGMVVHNETKAKLSSIFDGYLNPNYGNKWTAKQKEKMSKIAKERHASGIYYGENWRKLQGETSKKFWRENPEKKKEMAKKVSDKKKKYFFVQYGLDGVPIKKWDSVEDILKENPTFQWQNIYNVCNGYKKTHGGFQWRKFLKSDHEQN